MGLYYAKNFSVCLCCDYFSLMLVFSVLLITAGRLEGVHYKTQASTMPNLVGTCIRVCNFLSSLSLSVLIVVWCCLLDTVVIIVAAVSFLFCLCATASSCFRWAVSSKMVEETYNGCLTQIAGHLLRG